VFKVSAFCLDTCADECATVWLPYQQHASHVHCSVTPRSERRYTVKAVHVVDNSGTTSRSIISCIGAEIFVQINRILTKFCLRKLGVPVIMTHRVHAIHIAISFHWANNSMSLICEWLIFNMHHKSEIVFCKMPNIFQTKTFLIFALHQNWQLWCCMTELC